MRGEQGRFSSEFESKASCQKDVLENLGGPESLSRSERLGLISLQMQLWVGAGVSSLPMDVPFMVRHPSYSSL